MDAGETIGANRQAGNVQQGHAANAAVGRKQNGEETLSGSANPGSVNPDSSKTGRRPPRNNRRPCYCDAGLARPDSVLITAEDGLLIIPRTRIRRGQSFLLPLQYSGEDRR